MSISFYLSWYINGELQEVSVADIRRCLSDCVIEDEPGYWHLQYDNLCDCHLSLEPITKGYCDNIAIMRPCDHNDLKESVYQLLKLGNGVLYYSGCRGPIVASADVEKHLPPDMIEALGPVIVAQSGADVVQFED